MNVMIKSFLILSGEISGPSRDKAIKHCHTLANRYGCHLHTISSCSFTILLIADCAQLIVDSNDQRMRFILGKIECHPHTWDRYLIIEISADGIVVETDYTGSIPVFYSRRGGFCLSNIEPCVFLATNSSLADVNYENLYGFLRYSHFIWDETAWNHILQILPDSRYVFSSEGRLLSDTYRESVKASDSRCLLNDTQVADELYELNRSLVLRSLAEADDVVLPLSAGYDSRLIFAVLAEEEKTRGNLRCYTYGGAGSLEVESARRLTLKKNVDWKHIELPCSFLSRTRLEAISDIFGASLHMHGMYQMEFMDEIIKKYGVSASTRFTSGFMTGVPAGQHCGLMNMNGSGFKLSDVMNQFSQSKVWLDDDLSKMPVFRDRNFHEIAEARYRKAFDRFNGTIHQKSVMFDVWTRQRNFISYYPRVFEWYTSIVSPHMCPEYANFFMSLSKRHLWNRKAVELMFLRHYPDIAGVASNSNGIKAMGQTYHSALFLVSAVLRKLGLPNPMPGYFKNAPIEFDLQAVRNNGEESAYPLLAPSSELAEFLNGFGGRSLVDNAYDTAKMGSVRGYERLIALQAVALNSLLTERLGA